MATLWVETFEHGPADQEVGGEAPYWQTLVSGITWGDIPATDSDTIQDDDNGGDVDGVGRYGFQQVGGAIGDNEFINSTASPPNRLTDEAQCFFHDRVGDTIFWACRVSILAFDQAPSSNTDHYHLFACSDLIAGGVAATKYLGVDIHTTSTTTNQPNFDFRVAIYNADNTWSSTIINTTTTHTAGTGDADDLCIVLEFNTSSGVVKLWINGSQEGGTSPTLGTPSDHYGANGVNEVPVCTAGGITPDSPAKSGEAGSNYIYSLLAAVDDDSGAGDPSTIPWGTGGSFDKTTFQKVYLQPNAVVSADDDWNGGSASADKWERVDDPNHDCPQKEDYIWPDAASGEEQKFGLANLPDTTVDVFAALVIGEFEAETTGLIDFTAQLSSKAAQVQEYDASSEDVNGRRDKMGYGKSGYFWSRLLQKTPETTPAKWNTGTNPEDLINELEIGVKSTDTSQRKVYMLGAVAIGSGIARPAVTQCPESLPSRRRGIKHLIGR